MQYSGGLSEALWGLSCSTVEGASTVEDYLAVQWRAIVQYGGGCEVQWSAILVYSGGCMALQRDLVISPMKVCCFQYQTL